MMLSVSCVSTVGEEIQMDWLFSLDVKRNITDTRMAETTQTREVDRRPSKDNPLICELLKPLRGVCEINTAAAMTYVVEGRRVQGG